MYLERKVDLSPFQGVPFNGRVFARQVVEALEVLIGKVLVRDVHALGDVFCIVQVDRPSQVGEHLASRELTLKLMEKRTVYNFQILLSSETKYEIKL